MIADPLHANAQIGAATQVDFAREALGTLFIASLAIAGWRSWRGPHPFLLAIVVWFAMSLLAVCHVVPLRSMSWRLTATFTCPPQHSRRA